MSRSYLGVAAVLLAAFLHTARTGDEPRIGFAPGFPAAGPAKGEILVRGVVRIPEGWAVAGPARLEAYQNGGVVTGVSIPVDQKSGTWAGSIQGLDPNRPYYVKVTAPLSNGTGEPARYAILGECSTK